MSTVKTFEVITRTTVELPDGTMQTSDKTFKLDPDSVNIHSHGDAGMGHFLSLSGMTIPDPLRRREIVPGTGEEVVENARRHVGARAVIEEAEAPFRAVSWPPVVTPRPCESLTDWLLQLVQAKEAGHDLAVCEDPKARMFGFIEDETDEWVCLKLVCLHIGDPIPEVVAKGLGLPAEEIKQLLHTGEGRTLLIRGALPIAPPASDEKLAELSATWCAEAVADKPMDVGEHHLVRPGLPG